MSLRSAVSRAVHREKTDNTRAPTLAQLLLPKTHRTVSTDAAVWLDTHDVVQLLESLAAHLLRTLPDDVLEEADKWVDLHKGRRAAVPPTLDTELSQRRLIEHSRRPDVQPGCVAEYCVWNGKQAELLTVLKEPPRAEVPPGGPSRAHQHRRACVAATAPLLVPLRHEALVPVYGHTNEDAGVGLLHPRLPTELQSLLAQRRGSAVRLTSALVLAVARDAAAGLSHLHAVNILHRNVRCAAVYPRGPAEGNDGPPDEETVWMLGGLYDAARSSRKRVLASAWLPETHAPESAHSRCFDQSTDVYGLGLCLLDVCCYGDMQTALELARLYHHQGVVPRVVPPGLWSALLAPCLSTIPEQRPTAVSVHHTALRLLAEGRQRRGSTGFSEASHGIAPPPSSARQQKGRAATPPPGALVGNHHFDAIPLADDGVGSATMTALQRVGAPATAMRDPALIVDGLLDEGWELLCQALKQNKALRTLTFRDSSIHLDALELSSEAHLESLRVEKCTVSDSPDGAGGARLVNSQWCDGLTSVVATHLTSLSLVRCTVGDFNLGRGLRHLLPRAPCLTTLRLQAVGVGRETADMLAVVAADVTAPFGNTLRELDLRDNVDMPGSALTFLCSRWLQRAAGVRVLRVGGVAWDYYAVGSLAQLLRQTAGLDVLDLRGTELSDPALHVLTSGLKANSVAKTVIRFDPPLVATRQSINLEEMNTARETSAV